MTIGVNHLRGAERVFVQSAHWINFFSSFFIPTFSHRHKTAGVFRVVGSEGIVSSS